MLRPQVDEPVHDGQVSFVSDTPEVWGLYSTYSGGLAFDIGANGGMTAAIFAQHFDQVIACEPAVESYRHLVKNAALNVLACNLAVSDHDGDVTLREVTITDGFGELVTGDSLTVTWGPQTGERVVPCITLDQLAIRYGQPDFVKIDTEGHETQVLAGGTTVFDSDPQFVIEVHSAADGQWIMDYLIEHDCAWRRISEQWSPTPEYRDNHYWIVSR